MAKTFDNGENIFGRFLEVNCGQMQEFEDDYNKVIKKKKKGKKKSMKKSKKKRAD